jgi:WS/DGAT/MGAT family acyltransferase
LLAVLSFMPPTQALSLYAETAARPINVGAVALLRPPEGADGQDLRQMFAAALARNRVAPVWRRRAHRPLTSLGQWSWRTEAEVDLDHHVQLTALPRPAGMTELWDLISQLHSGRLELNRPLWNFSLIDGLADGRVAVYVKMHHAQADEISATRLMRQIVSTDPNKRGMPTVWEAPGARRAAGDADSPEPRGPADAVRDVAGIPAALADTVWRAARRRGGSLTLAAPGTPFSGPTGADRTFAGAVFALDRLRLVAEDTGATLDEVVLAMCSGALRRYLLARNALPKRPLTAMVPVSLRADGSHVGAAELSGNKVGALTCSLGTHLPDPAQRLAAVQASITEGRAAFAGRGRLQVLAMSALGVAPLPLTMTLGRALGPLRPPSLLISNVSGSSGPLYWNGARLEALYPLSVPVDGQALNITCTSIDDRIAFGLTGCRRAVPAIDSLADLLGREITLLEEFSRRPRFLTAFSRERRLAGPKPAPELSL